MLEHATFIEYPEEFRSEYLPEDPAPVFRRGVAVRAQLQRAVLALCGLGYGYCYINGRPVSEDLFTAPVSDYNKTLWYSVYEVTELLHTGDNLLAAILGNGFFNESMRTAWSHNEAPWRGAPKLLLELELVYPDATERIVSDGLWVCSKKLSPVRFNQLRSGETYDARLGERWREPGCDDAGWVPARLSKAIPAGVLRECLCAPIRAEREYPAVACFRNAAGNLVYDFGQNMSGYIRLNINQPAGNCITVRYAEQLKQDGSRELNGMDSPFFYKDGEFQTDRLICSGGEDVWSPRFAYHGFRYAEMEGLREAPQDDAPRAVFVHQAVEELSEFACSDDTVNRIYRCGKMATLSNLFYMPTDCPTREKLGWANDAQASTEQMLQNFDVAPLFEKWLQDILDSMKEDGAIPGIIPSPGWGYEWGTGPVSSGILFEVPVQIYRYTGKDTAIRRAYPAFLKHLNFILDKADPQEGLIGYGLCDWAGPFERMNYAPTPVKLTDTLLAFKFCRMTAFAARLCGDSATADGLDNVAGRLKETLMRAYITQDGRCTVPEQTAVAMFIALDAHDNLEPLKKQLYELLAERDFHHHCGMLGMQYLYPALDICGFQEEAYRIVTAKGRPSYTEWLDNGATTLWEMWHTGESKNHHMNSCVLAWFVKTMLGLRPADEAPGFARAELRPYFLTALDFCKGRYKTAAGVYEIAWEKQQDATVLLRVQVPQGTRARLILSGYTIGESGSSEADLQAGRHDMICRMMGLS